MRCPLCEGDLEPITLRTAGGEALDTERCTQCGGFWFGKPLDDVLDPSSVAEYDRPVPNYSLKSLSLTCPLDKALLQQCDHDDHSAGQKLWECADCRGTFYPRGQLALATNLRAQSGPAISTIPVLSVRGQAMMATLMLSLGSVLVIASLDKVGGGGIGYQAATAEPLPSTGPNIIPLVLLALTYLAGTVLAVLGRRLPIILMGWGVIAICVFGFSVIIFTP